MPFFDLTGQNLYMVAAAAAGAIVIGAAFFLLSRSKSAKSDLIRGVVGKTTDFKEGEPKAVKIEGAKNAILVVRHDGKLHAVGNKCPHAGAALNSGVFSCGRIVCPLHGASFDVATGEIEDAGPCLNQARANLCACTNNCVFVSNRRRIQVTPACCSYQSLKCHWKEMMSLFAAVLPSSIQRCELLLHLHPPPSPDFVATGHCARNVLAREQ